jgi:chemotaxis protein MotB
MVGTDQRGSSDNFTLTKEDMTKLKEQLQKTVRRVTDFDKLKNQIEMTVTAEGLRIELLESASGTFFESGSARPNDDCKQLLSLLAQELGKLPNKISVEGHTDSKPYAGSTTYGNWELSTDRANAARRLMQQSGVRDDQIAQVRGYADQRLRTPKDPLAPSNRRISLIVQYVEVSAGGDSNTSATPTANAQDLATKENAAKEATPKDTSSKEPAKKD